MEYKVCVRCFTFNQSRYITQTMDGFVMQQTDFPFVCCIVDDASTDGEQEVITKYLDEHFIKDDVSYEKETDYAKIRFARHKENNNCYFAILFLRQNHHQIKKPKYQYLNEWQQGTPYQALCEGDDYWIASDKLQKQASFLDSHPDYSLVYCDEIIVGPDSKQLQRRKPKRYSGDCRKSLIENTNYIVTACVCFRYAYFEEWRAVRREVPIRMKLGDKPQWVYLSTKGKFQYIEEPMVAYRLLPESTSHFKTFHEVVDFYDNGEQIMLYLNKMLQLGVADTIIKRNASLNRARLSTQYSKKDMIATYKNELKHFPSLLFNIRLQVLFVLRVIGIKR